MPSAYLVAARRTPIGKFLGGLAKVPAPQLAAVAMRAALADARLPAEQVEQVLLGQVLTAGVGQAPARQAALAVGCSDAVAAVTLNKVCGSGLAAVMLAEQAIRAGDAELIVAGGMENMSRSPHLLLGSREGWKFGPQTLADSLLLDGLWCAAEQTAMGDLANATAEKEGVSRQDQDAWAAESHRRAVAAQAAGAFLREIAPVALADRRGETIVARDEGPRADTTADSLAQLRPAFAASGAVTAGNASQLSDGAAAVVVASERLARQQTGAIQARILAAATHGGPPRELFTAPVGAIEKALAKAKLRAAEIDLFELNEAFAAQCLACTRPLALPPEKVNVRGGAIALGHPIGASGARVLVTLLHALAAGNLRRGLAALCLGGGEAVAMVVERV